MCFLLRNCILRSLTLDPISTMGRKCAVKKLPFRLQADKRTKILKQERWHLPRDFYSLFPKKHLYRLSGLVPPCWEISGKIPAGRYLGSPAGEDTIGQDRETPTQATGWQPLVECLTVPGE